MSVAPIPPIAMPLVDPQTGQITPQWFLVISDLYTRTGGGAGLNLTAVNTTATNAQTTATQGVASAARANTAAAEAQTTANTALADATQAQSTANAAQNDATDALNGGLLRLANLSDLTSASTARTNLGVDQYAVSVWYDGSPSGSRYIPLAQDISLNIVLTVHTYAGVVPTYDTTFTINYIHAGITNYLCNLTLINGGNYSNTSAFGVVDLVAGDVIEIAAPSPDPTLANVSITLVLPLT